MSEGFLVMSCLCLEGRKKLNEASKSNAWWSDFEKHNCHWHFSGGKLDNEPFKNIFEMCFDKKVTHLFQECVQCD